jgi:hypothetical protein
LFVKQVPGSHASLREEYQAPVLAQMLRQHLALAHGEPPRRTESQGTDGPPPTLGNHDKTFAKSAVAKAGQKALLLIAWMENMKVLVE